jgi:outer membrane protein TolC
MARLGRAVGVVVLTTAAVGLAGWGAAEAADVRNGSPPQSGTAGPLRLTLIAQQEQAPPGAPPPALTVTPEGTLPLSLRDAIAQALRQNLDLLIEGYNPQARTQEVTREDAAFDPAAFAELTFSESKTPSATSVGGFTAFATSERETLTGNVGLRKRFTLGTQLELSFNNDRTDFNSPAQAVNPSYRTDLTLSLSQPLLKNFGIEVNETPLRLARGNLTIAQAVLAQRVQAVVVEVEGAYWDLIFTIEDLAARRRSLALAEALVRLNQARVRAGVAAPVEVTQAEATRAARLEEIITGEKAVRDAEDRLKRALNFGLAPDEPDFTIQPTDRPTVIGGPVPLEESLKAARERRPEILQAQEQVRNQEVSYRFTRNQLLPTLDLVGKIGTNGLGSTFNEDFDRGASGSFPTVEVGLLFEYPLGNRAARSDAERARLLLEQARTSLRNVDQQVSVEVREAVRQVRATLERIEATRRARELAAEQLRIEERRLEAGVSTTFQVLEFQDDLARAEANESRAATDYRKALAAVDRVTAATLEKYQLEP